MTERQLFKFAFLMGCARDGLTPGETRSLIARLEREVEKRADLMSVIKGGIGGAAAVGTGIASKLPTLALYGLGAAAVGGGGIGYLAAKLREGRFDADSAKKQELIAAYNSYSDQAKGLSEARKHQHPAVRLSI